jgi:divalent metal cation (Fe/Co/Zn/Cd) transporter
MVSPWPVASGGILAIIVIVGVFVIWRMLRDLRSGVPLRDERTQRITGTAATYAFYIGSYFMVALMLANLLNLEFLGTPLLDTGYALVVSILVNSLTFLGLRVYFNRKGDF